MHRNQIWRVAVGLTAAAIVASCTGGDNNEVLGPRPSGPNSIFQSYVALGNSITAGVQSSGINDSTQRRAFPVLLAQQMGVRFAIPRLAGRGCAPPVINFLTQARVGGGTSTTCELLVPTTSNLINNVAVPGAMAVDLADADGTPNSNTLTSLFLAGKSQVQRALENNPTFASIFIGGNDVFQAAVRGILAAVPGVSPGITPQAAFETSINAATNALTAGALGLKGVIVGVPNVTNIPLFFRASQLLPAIATNPAFATFQAATGFNASGTTGQRQPLTVDANCNGSTALLSFAIVPQIVLFRSNPSASGAHPPHIACATPATGFPAPVGEVFVLTAAEQTQIASAVAGYNTFLQTEANDLGFAYANVDPLLDSLRTAGQIPAFPNLTSATAPFGAWFSLDGFHVTDRTHRALTNYMINAINAKHGTNLVRISVP